MFAVEWADYRHHNIGLKKPEPHVEVFHDEQSACARRDELKAQGMIATMRPAVIKQKGSQTALKNQRGDRFNKGWALHR